MSKKLGLVLGAGGSRGVCHAGVIKALEEEGIRPDIITGCSMGSVIGACYSMGMTPEEMLARVSKLKRANFVDLSPSPIAQKAFMRGKKLDKILKSVYGETTFDQLEIPFACVASDLYSGRLVTINSGLVYKAVLASSSIPVVFPPAKQEGRLLVDGGVLCRMPIKQAFTLGADAVIAVDALVNTADSVSKLKNIFSVVTRLFDIMDYNQSEMAKKLDTNEQEVWIEPEMKGLNQYEVKNFKQAFDAGYAAAKDKMQEIKELIK